MNTKKIHTLYTNGNAMAKKLSLWAQGLVTIFVFSIYSKKPVLGSRVEKQIVTSPCALGNN
jgi:hypothetical protein